MKDWTEIGRLSQRMQRETYLAVCAWMATDRVNKTYGNMSGSTCLTLTTMMSTRRRQHLMPRPNYLLE